MSELSVNGCANAVLVSCVVCLCCCWLCICCPHVLCSVSELSVVGYADAGSLHVHGDLHREHDPSHDAAVHDRHGAVGMLDVV